MINLSGRSVTSVTLHLLIINTLLLAASSLFAHRGIDLNDLLGLHYYASDRFHWWQFVTYMFMHGNFSHLFNNMFTLYMFGRLLEMVWGERRYIIYYLVTGVGAGIVQQLAWRYDMGEMVSEVLQQNPDSTFTYGELIKEGLNIVGYGRFTVDHLVTVGASGSVFGILLAFGMMFPDARILLLIPPIPMKAKWLVILYGLFELFAGIHGIQTGVAHFAHLGGMLFGFFLIQLWKKDKRWQF